MSRFLELLSELEEAWSIFWKDKNGPSDEAIRALAKALRGLVSEELSDEDIEGFVALKLDRALDKNFPSELSPRDRSLPSELRPAEEFLEVLERRKGPFIQGRKALRHNPPEFYVLFDIKRYRRKHYRNLKQLLVDVVKLLIDRGLLNHEIPGLVERRPWGREESFTRFDLPDGTKIYVYTTASASDAVKRAIKIIKEYTKGEECLLFPSNYQP